MTTVSFPSSIDLPFPSGISTMVVSLTKYKTPFARVLSIMATRAIKTLGLDFVFCAMALIHVSAESESSNTDLLNKRFNVQILIKEDKPFFQLF